MNIHTSSRVALALALFAAPQIAFAQSQTDKKDDASDPAAWRLSAGVNYSTGDYGETEDTEVISTPIGIKYSKDNFSVKVTVPFVHISGPGSLLDTPQGRDASGGGSGGDDSGGDDNSGSGSSNSGSGSSGGEIEDDDVTLPGVNNSRSGLGDVSVTLAYTFDFGSDFYADLAGRVKLPTASKAKRIGTGKTDFTASMELGKDIGDLSIYAGGRRRFMGKPAASTLRDTWGAGGGVSYKASKGLTLGADYDWQQSAYATNGPSSEVTGWASVRLSQTVRMQVFASTGLNANSADFAGGTSISWRFR